MRAYRKPKPKFTTVQNVPCWAASYCANGDSSGLSHEDYALCREYGRKLERQGLRLVAPIDGTRNEFCTSPAFGKACDTEDWTAEVLPPDRIVFRKYWNMHDRRWEPIAFLPDVPTSRRDFVMSYEHTGQHSEASLDWYRATSPCPEGEYAWLLDEMVTHFDYRPRVMKKLILRRET